MKTAIYFVAFFFVLTLFSFTLSRNSYAQITGPTTGYIHVVSDNSLVPVTYNPNTREVNTGPCQLEGERRLCSDTPTLEASVKFCTFNGQEVPIYANASCSTEVTPPTPTPNLFLSITFDPTNNPVANGAYVPFNAGEEFSVKPQVNAGPNRFIERGKINISYAENLLSESEIRFTKNPELTYPTEPGFKTITQGFPFPSTTKVFSFEFSKPGGIQNTFDLGTLHLKPHGGPTETSTLWLSYVDNELYELGNTTKLMVNNTIGGQYIIRGQTNSCPLKPKGDANCDNKVDINNDFLIWKFEFLNGAPHGGASSFKAKFTGSTGNPDVNNDFLAWKRGLLDAAIAH